MEVAPGNARTFTSPLATHNRLHTSSSASSVQHHNSTSSQPSRSSDSTQNTTSSTLFPPTSSTPSPFNGGPVGASDNVINKVANKEASLFQLCLTLRNRLSRVPGFEEHIQAVERSLGEDDLDPVELLWNTFRQGYPFLTLYNALEPPNPLWIDEAKVAPAKRHRAAVAKFLYACVNQLKFPTEECFILSDIEADDTSGFVKVVGVVHRILEILVREGRVQDLEDLDGSQSGQPGTKRTQRQHIVDELVRTERTYVQHLELLHAFELHVQNNGILTRDAIHDIFLNLGRLLDYQRRFLIRVEQTNAQPEEQQNWGKLFSSSADTFSQYVTFIENQTVGTQTAQREFDRLHEAGGPPEMRQMVDSLFNFSGFLLKPFQRLSKYPLLLRELRDKGDLDKQRRLDLTAGIETLTKYLNQSNAGIDRADRLEAVNALQQQVEDWKHHRVDAFGELLLHGTFTVAKGDPTKDSEREVKSKPYRMYLFEKILLCCKEINPNKQKNKLMNRPNASATIKGKPKLQLKGRIFMQNVTETSFLAKPGQYTCQIYWRGDDSIEHFIIRFSSEEVMKRWHSQIELQRKNCLEQSRNQPTTSNTEFTYMQNRTDDLENPYRDDENPEDDDMGTPPSYAGSEYNMSRNGSSTSLRSRSNTGESGFGPRIPPKQLGFSGQPLTLRTQQIHSGMMSPIDKASHFSPNLDSPTSTRTSGSSGMFPFPRQATPGDDQSRFTTPAAGRGQTAAFQSMDVRSGRTQANGVNAAYQAALAQNRFRSASTPDVNRRVPTNAPPVPSVPSHLSAQAQRSQTSSPVYLTGKAAQQLLDGKRPIITHHQTLSTDSQYGYGSGGFDQARGITPLPLQSDAGVMSPNLGSSQTFGDPSQPSQLKVKVKVPSEGSTMTLVVGFNISFQSLKDRIDAKLQRYTNVTLASGSVKLKYLYDDEHVSIQTDEDVQTAFDEWREQQQEEIVGQLGEIELFCMT